MTERFPDLWRFTWGANISLTIWASAQQLDTLIVGWLADPASAGMFHVAKRVNRVVQQVGSQVEAVVYPDLSRLWAAGQRTTFVRLVLQTEAILATFGAACFAAMFLLGGWAIRLTAGPRFAAAAPLLTVQIFAAPSPSAEQRATPPSSPWGDNRQSCGPFSRRLSPSTTWSHRSSI